MVEKKNWSLHVMLYLHYIVMQSYLWTLTPLQVGNDLFFSSALGSKNLIVDSMKVCCF